MNFEADEPKELQVCKGGAEQVDQSQVKPIKHQSRADPRKNKLTRGNRRKNNKTNTRTQNTDK